MPDEIIPDGVLQRFLIESHQRWLRGQEAWRHDAWSLRSVQPVDPAARDLEGAGGTDPARGPLLVWRRTPSDAEPSPAFADPATLRDLPPPAIVHRGVPELGAALANAMETGIDLRDLRLSGSRLGYPRPRHGALQIPRGADLAGSVLDSQIVGWPRGVTRGVVFEGVLMRSGSLRGVFRDCDFSRAEMHGVDVFCARFVDCRFEDARISAKMRGPVAFEGGSGDLTRGAAVSIESGHPADPPLIGDAYPAFRDAQARWRAMPDVRRHHRRWWWWGLRRRLLMQPPLKRWPYPEEIRPEEWTREG